MKRIVIIDFIAALLILLFLYTSFSKIFDLWYFKYDLSKQPFPLWLQQIFVWLIPTIEIIIAVCLIFRNTKKWGFYLALGLMAIFTGYTIAILIHFFPYVPCGCGGVIRTLTWPQHLFFNVAVVGLIITALILEKKELNDRVPSRMRRRNL